MRWFDAFDLRLGNSFCETTETALETVLITNPKTAQLFMLIAVNRITIIKYDIFIL